MPGQFQKGGGIFSSVHTDGEHLVVAGLFALAAQARAHHPHERIEPEDRAQRLGADLHEPVVTADVRQLVAEDDVYASERPVMGVVRQKNVRPEDPPRGEEMR